MKVLVDTSIWSLALRRNQNKLQKVDNALVTELEELINESRVILIGPIKQELLSGISSVKQFQILKKKLQSFENYPISSLDYEKAAEFFNICRKKGIQGSQVDFLICAFCHNNHFSIFTTDKDFDNYSKYIEITKHSTRF